MPGTPARLERGSATSPLELCERLFADARDPVALGILDAALARGVVTLEHLERVLDFLRRSGALPAKLDARVARHFAMWLEIVNHGRFVPIITAEGRLRALEGILAQRLGGRTEFTLADVGTGQPPYTTIDLARRFPLATIHAFDLYVADAMVYEPRGAYAAFDAAGGLRGIHCGDPKHLHTLLLDWDTTRTQFERALQQATPKRKSVADDAETIWRVERRPVSRLLKRAGAAHIHLHVVPHGDFSLAALAPESLDVVWSFNCLLHYELDERRRALMSMARRCRLGGTVIEGYTSPTGSHAIYQLWERHERALVPLEFGWSAPNLARPLWPLHRDDPQTEVLAALLHCVKHDSAVRSLFDAEGACRAPLAADTISRIAGCLRTYGMPVKTVGAFFVHEKFDEMSVPWPTPIAIADPATPNADPSNEH